MRLRHQLQREVDWKPEPRPIITKSGPKPVAKPVEPKKIVEIIASVVIETDSRPCQYLVVTDIEKNIRFPRHHKNESMSPEEAAKEAVARECGIEVTFTHQDQIGVIESATADRISQVLCYVNRVPSALTLKGAFRVSSETIDNYIEHGLMVGADVKAWEALKKTKSQSRP